MAGSLLTPPDRSGRIVIGLLLVNAAAILCFRFFATVDGPLHVLHASLWDAPWSTLEHYAHGFVYDTSGRTIWLGDRILTVILALTTPERAYVLILALACCAVVLSLVMYLRAHGVRLGIAALWLAPITLNTLVIMGLYNFMFGLAISISVLAWWRSYEGSSRLRWAGVFVGLALALVTHRGAAVLLGLMFLPTFIFDLLGDSTTPSKDGRKRSLQMIMLVILLLLIIAYALGQMLLMTVQLMPTQLPPLTNDFLLRPYFLVDHAREQWLVRGMMLLFLIAICAGAVVRWRSGRKVLWHDMLLVLALVFCLIAWLGNTPQGRLLILSDRAQVVVALVLVLWLCVMANASRRPIAWVISGAALCALPLHVVRIIHTEEFMAQFEPAHEATVEACQALAPGSLVYIVRSGADRLLQHEASFVALRHGGIVVAANEQLRSIHPDAEVRGRWARFARDPYWLYRHWRSGIPVEVDQLLFIGDGIDRTVSKHPWPVLLDSRYELTFVNAYTRIYTAIPDNVP